MNRNIIEMEQGSDRKRRWREKYLMVDIFVIPRLLLNYAWKTYIRTSEYENKLYQNIYSCISMLSKLSGKWACLCMIFMRTNGKIGQMQKAGRIYGVAICISAHSGNLAVGFNLVSSQFSFSVHEFEEKYHSAAATLSNCRKFG